MKLTTFGARTITRTHEVVQEFLTDDGADALGALGGGNLKIDLPDTGTESPSGK